jgi:hypothetical protein
MGLLQMLIAILLAVQHSLAQTVVPFVIDGPLGG